MKIVDHENESYYKISNHDTLRPFFMSIVSDSNHWMFISSNGGLSAGRKNPEYALFPYYTEDKITESADITGSKTILRVNINSNILVWEPLSDRFSGRYTLNRNLYKSVYGNKIIFEEINHDLGLIFRYQWSSSGVFGFVKKSELINTSDTACLITLLDGIQNIMPYGVPGNLQNSTSNLVDAYKRNELEPTAGIGIYALSAIIVDKAEPSEALKANIAWSSGIENATYLLSSGQLGRFRQKSEIQGEYDIKGEKGAYFVTSEILLPAKASKTWRIIANVSQNHSQIISLRQSIIENSDLEKQIQNDIDLGTKRLIQLVAAADGLQFTSGKMNDARHFSSVLFNIMRGGIFDNNYFIEKGDFVRYLGKANKEAANDNQNIIDKPGELVSRSSLIEYLTEIGNADLIRLGIEYLPLKFSRRHGDPSRPWNTFSIITQNETDGSKILNYEGNWRDLFQNWEALACSYPEFTEGMIFKFLNASTFDGYNPYRVTKDGFDWEMLEPDNPWSYIGYWGDHQIIYLLKLLEISEKYYPGRLQSYFDKEWFVYAAVPYILKPYDKILLNPRETIEFDHHWNASIRERCADIGADGALITDNNSKIYHVNFIEKILATVLAKMSNFIPEAGIWMNTQRPEWNDANNALVGEGVSMVTLYYLYRFMKFFKITLDSSDLENIKISGELAEFYHSVRVTLSENRHLLSGSVNNKERKDILDQLGTAASEYRSQIYQKGFWGKKRSISLAGLHTFTQLCIDFIEHSIRTNKRADSLYNAYNLISVGETEVSYSHLEEMLEGQAAVLSSGFLSSEKALELLDNLKSSSLFREDQYSYILYPEKKLPSFLQKNIIPINDAKSSELIKRMVAGADKRIVEQDVLGNYHFNGNFKNARDLEIALNTLAGSEYGPVVEKEKDLLLDLYEKVFNHRSFTGRSGTFFSYEGLGSIYWHMVSKLRLAVQETCLVAIEEKADPAISGRLLDHYYEIDAGIGVHKPPELYGAFPTDPYSHTPKHRGAQQPGMTGQVKEDILARFGELGVFVREGKIFFNPCLLRKEEFLKEAALFECYSIRGEKELIPVNAGQLAFTVCQVPVIYNISDNEKIIITGIDGRIIEFEGKGLDTFTSNMIFSRTGNIKTIEVSIKLLPFPM